MDDESAKKAVLRVGEGGRGFVVEPTDGMRYVITAAHCLPFFPPAHTFSYTEERLYPNILGELEGDLTVSAECCFVDPISDIAALEAIDGQAAPELAEEFEALVDAVMPFEISDIPKTDLVALASKTKPEDVRARMLSLDGRWFECRARRIKDGPLGMTKSAEETKGGMSGSPIVTMDWRAIGIVTTGTEGPHARLMRSLPGWLLRELTSAPKG